MATPRESLKQKLRVLAGLPSYGLSDQQLDLVVADIAATGKVRVPTPTDWKAAVTAHVPGVGTVLYAGEDMSNLNTLLQQILNQGGQGIRPVKKGT